MKATSDDLLARRYLAQSRAPELDRMVERHAAERVSETTVRTYDIRHIGWTEFVLVPDDDPRVDTYERYY